MPRKQQQDRKEGIGEFERDRESVRTSGREEGPGRIPGQERGIREGERGTQSDESFVSRETERVGGERQEPRRPRSLDRGRTASPHRSGSERSASGRSGEQGVNERVSRGSHEEEESGLEEETSL